MEYVTTNEDSKTTNKSVDEVNNTNFAPVSEFHEKPEESNIANKHEISTISSNSVTAKSQYSNCKVCKIKILFKHMNIHMKKHRHPLSYDIDRSKNKIEQINQSTDKSQSKEPSNSKQPEENSGTQNDMAELIEGSTKTILQSCAK